MRVEADRQMGCRIGRKQGCGGDGYRHTQIDAEALLMSRKCAEDLNPRRNRITVGLATQPIRYRERLRLWIALAEKTTMPLGGCLPIRLPIDPDFRVDVSEPLLDRICGSLSKMLGRWDET